MASIESTPFPTAGSAGTDTGASASTNATASADEVITRVARSAHDVVDRVAEKALPAVDRVRSSLTGAREAVRVHADNLTVMQDEWLGNCRASVRERPLTSVAIGVVAGLLLGKLLSR